MTKNDNLYECIFLIIIKDFLLDVDYVKTRMIIYAKAAKKNLKLSYNY